MQEQTFNVEIHETWKKTVKVKAETRPAAIAKAKADYIEEYHGADCEGIAYDKDAVKFNVDAKLEWPDGNPE